MIVDNSFCTSCRHTNELDELNSPSDTGNLSIAVVYYTVFIIILLWVT